MNQYLFASGLLIFGFSLMFLMPASMKRTWAELEHKPSGGDAVLLMMRFLGLIVIVMGLLVITGVAPVDFSSVQTR